MPPTVLVVDNYDSFTYNLVHLLEALGASCRVLPNDAPELAADAGAYAPYAGVLLSPGPGRPEDAGRTLTVLEACAGRVPLLGVCLGHQAIAHYFGARVVRARRPIHGKSEAIHHCEAGPFRGLPQGFLAARYNSLVVDAASLPEQLHATAWSPEGEILALTHAELSIVGVQFHPESVLSSPTCRELVAHWLEDL